MDSCPKCGSTNVNHGARHDGSAGTQIECHSCGHCENE